MDIKQLKYFYTIVEEGQITSAAKKLHMAQPPLTYQLKSLEEELGMKLIERGSRSRNIKLTNAGRIFYKRVKQILALTETAANEVKDLQKGISGTLSVGTISSSGSYILNSKFNEFHKKYPFINFELSEGNTYELLELLSKGIIELAFVRTPFSSLEIKSIYLHKEPMIAAMRKELNWTENKVIRICELNEKPLIFYKRYKEVIYKACADCNFEPNVFCINEDARTSLLWAKHGLGIAIVPKSSFELISSSNLICKEIDNELLLTQLALAWSKNSYISPAAENFINIFSHI
ncbi:transcriptional regulator, LysR family [Clostridium sp. DL-VIII]|uniref:LysR family transcriptional regulator n=1 Tax=Clostridium sp. DL-VIII TaxID=641107 RepID=UPI00023B0896|nr:LysR family transcriptional regulator [Clostridium sp. DL-VIII]EHJ01169.1 transcriptional regulator, LysR family [Clostridium sp. DL-VIII]